jgi:hypothetical protein
MTCYFFNANVLAATKSPSATSADASRNGAPGNVNGAFSPMKNANVSVNSNGPII